MGDLRRKHRTGIHPKRRFFLENKCAPDDTIIIHDGIRPLIEASVLSDVIVKCEQYGNAVTALPYNEQIFLMDDDISTTKYIPGNPCGGFPRPRRINLKIRRILSHRL